MNSKKQREPVISCLCDRIRLNQSDKEIEVLVHGNISTPDGLAFDWIHKNLYWTDAGKNHIQLLTLQSKQQMRKTLFDDKLDEPRALVVDPRDKERLVYRVRQNVM